jgi:inorganic pyrophosphatase
VGRPGIHGDGDPLDICVLSEKAIHRGDILLQAVPIGGFRTVDGNHADDKIIAVLKGDFIYGDIEAIWQCPQNLIERLRHYFLTYKDCPGESEKRRMEITHTYGKEEAYDVIRLAREDYQETYKDCHELFKQIHARPPQ